MSDARAQSGGAAAAPESPETPGLTEADMAARLRRIADDLEGAGQRPARTDGSGAPAQQQVPASAEMASIERLWPISPRLTAAVGLVAVAIAASMDLASAGGLALSLVGLAMVGFSIELARGQTHRKIGGGA